MSYIRFDRHAEMSSETLGQIMDILRDVRFDTSFELTNMIYGLFDGYLYDELLPMAEVEISNELYAKLEGIVSTIRLQSLASALKQYNTINVNNF